MTGGLQGATRNASVNSMDDDYNANGNANSVDKMEKGQGSGATGSVVEAVGAGKLLKGMQNEANGDVKRAKLR